MNFQNFLQTTLEGIAKELGEEFDRNFERKAFFDQPWPATKYPRTKGTTLVVDGHLRAGYANEVVGNQIKFTNSQPYANIHNEGGELTITAKMKKFFWAKYREAAGITGKTWKTNLPLKREAEYWKSLALMKVGSKIKIPKRQVIGHHPQADISIRRVVDINVEKFANQIAEALKQ